MKDFYDILFISSNTTFKYDVLREAISMTFSERMTLLKDEADVFSDEYRNSPDKQLHWTGFLKAYRLEEAAAFPDVVRRVQAFLAPVLEGKLPGSTWDPRSMKWQHQR